ncbi:MAG: glycosyltransferase family 39 protein [Vicinamibacterales bacterium]
MAIAWSLWLIAGTGLLFAWITSRVDGRSLAPVLRHRHAALGVAVFLGVVLAGLRVGGYPDRGWLLDEVPPRDIRLAVQSAFSAGWFHLYPPLNFYLLGAATSPFLTLHGRDLVDMDAPGTYATVHVVMRAFTVMMALATLLATMRLAARTVGASAAAFVPWLLAAVPIVAFYGKTSNVDMAYVFWLIVALIAFLRCLEERQLVHHVWLGCLVALAVATKDQAYGFFPGVALALLWQTWREDADRPVGARVAGVLGDRRLWAGAAACAVVYAVVLGVIWNPNGVREHVDVITGQGSAGFRMFPFTPAGLTQLLLTTVGVFVSLLGPVTAVLCLAGVVRVLRAPARFARLSLLLIPAVSYLVTFMCVVGYVYDRFLLGTAVVAVLFACLGIDTLLARLRGTTPRVLAGVATLAVALGPSVSLDWRLTHDSRFDAERWMAANLPEEPFVLGIGNRAYLPNLYPFRHQLLFTTIGTRLVAWGADVVVANRQWERPDQPSLEAAGAALAEAGYAPTLELPGTAGRHWLVRAAAWGTDVPDYYSNLDKIDPPIAVWIRPRETDAR